MMALILLAVCVALCGLPSVHTQECKPHGTEAPGDCVPAKNCQKVIENFVPTELSDFLQNNGCGIEPLTGDVKVCCPRVIAVSGGIFSAGPPSRTQSCGEQQKNNGSPWPFLVGLGSVHFLYNALYINCNGVLIHPQWVLTDASCFESTTVNMAFFGIGKANYSEIIKIPILNTFIPLDYDKRQDINSVALAKLVQAAPINDDISLVCLPPSQEYVASNRPRTVVHIGKFDDGSKLGGFEIRSYVSQEVPLKTCRTSSGLEILPTDNHVCTIGIQACNIPLNRPLALTLDNDLGGYVILGVGGRAADFCASDVISYPSVSSYLNYISANLQPTSPQLTLLQSATDLLRVLLSNNTVRACGRRLISGGGLYPFMAALGSGQVNSDGNVTFTSHCTGLVVSPSWILSDAKCTGSHPINYAAVGFMSLKTQYTQVSVRVTPPGYKDSPDSNTVALMQTTTPFIYSEYIQPVCVRHLLSFDNYTSLTALSTGYSFLQEIGLLLDTGIETITRVDDVNCQNSRFKTISSDPINYVCSLNINACSFHSNPPVLLERDPFSSQYTVVGVGGDNANFCKADVMAFARVRPLVPWIASVIDPHFEDEYQMLKQILMPQPNSG